MAELQATVREAVTPEGLKEVLERLHKDAKGGDVQAARVLLDRVLGRPAPAREAIQLDLGDELHEGSQGVAKASARIAAAVARGDMSAEDGSRAAAILQVTLRAHELASVEARLEALERVMDSR